MLWIKWLEMITPVYDFIGDDMYNKMVLFSQY